MRRFGIANSGTSLSARSIMSPLITKEKSPRLSRLIGIEISINTGLIVWLITASTKEVRSATHAVPNACVSVAKIRGTPTPVT